MSDVMAQHSGSAACSADQPALKPALRDPPPWHYLRAFAAILAVAAAIFGILALVGYWRFGSLTIAREYLRGERFIVEPRLVRLGEGQPGERWVVVTHIANFTDAPVRLFGSSNECGCMVAEQLPLTIAAGEQVEYRIVIAFLSKPGSDFKHTLVTYTDGKGMPELLIAFVGKVAE